MKITFQMTEEEAKRYGYENDEEFYDSFLEYIAESNTGSEMILNYGEVEIVNN